MCASHNLILLVSLVTLALVIVLVVKQEREPFISERARRRRDARRARHLAREQIAGWGLSGIGQKAPRHQRARRAESSRTGDLKASGTWP